MPWMRVRTGVALQGDVWRVIVRLNDDEPRIIGPIYLTEADAEAAAKVFAKKLREEYITRTYQGEGHGT